MRYTGNQFLLEDPKFVNIWVADGISLRRNFENHMTYRDWFFEHKILVRPSYVSGYDGMGPNTYVVGYYFDNTEDQLLFKLTFRL